MQSAQLTSANVGTTPATVTLDLIRAGQPVEYLHCAVSLDPVIHAPHGWGRVILAGPQLNTTMRSRFLGMPEGYLSVERCLTCGARTEFLLDMRVPAEMRSTDERRLDRCFDAVWEKVNQESDHWRNTHECRGDFSVTGVPEHLVPILKHAARRAATFIAERKPLSVLVAKLSNGGWLRATFPLITPLVQAKVKNPDIRQYVYRFEDGSDATESIALASYAMRNYLRERRLSSCGNALISYERAGGNEESRWSARISASSPTNAVNAVTADHDGGMKLNIRPEFMDGVQLDGLSAQLRSLHGYSGS